MSIRVDGIIRVFCRRTSYTPDDEMAFVGPPPGLFVPEHNEIHISVPFTWDKPLAEKLAFQWEGVTNRPVKLGGPVTPTPSFHGSRKPVKSSKRRDLGGTRSDAIP